MKPLFIILIITIFLLMSCEKEYLLPCEINQTFSLHFANFRGVPVELVVDTTHYSVKPDEIVSIDTPVEFEDKIFVLNEFQDTISHMEGRPNACANYNYYW